MNLYRVLFTYPNNFAFIIMILKSSFQGENRQTNLQIYVLIEDLLLELKNPRNWVN